ncbi:MAG: hypothetical protein Kow0068_01140 [Marinilabiliales bacterium]
MIYYIVLAISFFIIAFIIRYFRRVFYAVAEVSVSVVDKLMSDKNDEEKLDQVQKDTYQLFFNLLKMFLLVIAAFVIGSIPIIIYCLLYNLTYNDLVFSSFYSILSISIGATIPFLIPISKKNVSGYSELSQLLHRMALNNYNLAYKLFKKEVKKIKRRNLKINNKFVIVSGLARAGTTSLMNDLAKINNFVSLSYANMPFLLCPNLWAKIYKPKSKKLKERSHKDGIMIGYDSNEALEEFFFKVKANDAYIDDEFLSEYEISEEDYNDYLEYQTIIKLDDNKIYLAKNNNFILRYKSVRNFNDEFIMLILFRDPLTHASSLMEKHFDYIKLQEEDPFVLEYMNWLGHHEFGKNQKPFLLNNSKSDFSVDKTNLDYWLKLWINYYKNILPVNHPNTILINYDEYCNQPGKIVRTVIEKLNIDAETPEYKAFKNKRKTVQNYSVELYEEAMTIYNQLLEKTNYGQN